MTVASAVPLENQPSISAVDFPGRKTKRLNRNLIHGFSTACTRPEEWSPTSQWDNIFMWMLINVRNTVGAEVKEETSMQMYAVVGNFLCSKHDKDMSTLHQPDTDSTRHYLLKMPTLLLSGPNNCLNCRDHLPTRHTQHLPSVTVLRHLLQYLSISHPLTTHTSSHSHPTHPSKPTQTRISMHLTIPLNNHRT